MLSLEWQSWVNPLVLASYTDCKLHSCKVVKAVSKLDAGFLYMVYKRRNFLQIVIVSHIVSVHLSPPNGVKELAVN